MTGKFIKRKIGNIKKKIVECGYCVRRDWNRKRIRCRDFTIIANNCWAGKTYQYLGMPYLSPTVGLYFFAEDYIKFVSNLRYYLSLDLKFISAKESRYEQVLKERGHDKVPLALLDDVEIVFLHYSSEEEAREKWNRRKQRVNYENLFIKFSKMNLCTDKEMKVFDELPFENKFLLNNCKAFQYGCEVFWNGESNKKEILSDTNPFPGNLKLSKLLKNRSREWNKMYILEKVHNLKKEINKWWKKYFTIDGTYTSLLPDVIYLKKLYKKRMGRELNLKKPITYTEKLNWLKLYDRKKYYTRLVDKYEVREYVAEKIGEQYLVPLLNYWEKVEDIDFSLLPSSCVLKCTHDNGVIILNGEKEEWDIQRLKEELRFHLNRDYYRKCKEWPYKNVNRRIICEKYMENTNGDKLVDYKVFCFDGVPKFVMVNSSRFEEGGVKTDMYDMNWQHMDMQDGPYPMAGDIFPKPQCFDEMCRLASVLSAGIPTIRVDFNYWNNQLYFGELTFFHMAGLESFNPVEWDAILGSWVSLPKKNK